MPSGHSPLPPGSGTHDGLKTVTRWRNSAPVTSAERFNSEGQKATGLEARVQGAGHCRASWSSQVAHVSQGFSASGIFCLGTGWAAAFTDKKTASKTAAGRIENERSIFIGSSKGMRFTTSRRASRGKKGNPFLTASLAGWACLLHGRVRAAMASMTRLLSS